MMIASAYQTYLDARIPARLARYGWPTREPDWRDEFDALDPMWGRLEPCWDIYGGQTWKPVDAGHRVYHDQGLESIADGVLTMGATLVTNVPFGAPYQKASMLASPREFGYGWYEMRAKLVGTGGAKLCWWMYADPAVAEIDMLEQRQDCSPWYATGSLHWSNYTGRQTFTAGPLWYPCSCWHTYGFQWWPGGMRWYVDGQLFGRMTCKVAGPMHMLISLEMPSPSSTGGTAAIEYVRHWRAS